MLARHRSCAAVLLLLGAALAGCGKSLPSEAAGGGAGAPVTTVAGTGQLAASALATKNTTRLGGTSPVADAAGVALATNPGLTAATRPQAVVLVDDRNWPAALAAAALASSPLHAPLLYSEGSSLPALSAQALAAMRPRGTALLGGAQVIEVGTSAAPSGYLTRVLTGSPTAGERASRSGSRVGGSAGGAAGGATASGEANGVATATKEAGAGAQSAAESKDAEQARLAAQVERVVASIQGGAPRRVIVVGMDGPPALAMPAAGLAAESGAPILPVSAADIPRATRRVLAHLHRPTIYAVGPPAAVSHAVLAKLERFGSVRRIYAGASAVGSAGPGTSGEDPADNAIAVARFSDGAFGWGVEQPGHGLVFASASRPLDAPAAAPLSASGDYAPLLLLERADEIPTVLREYLRDIQPAYGDTPEYAPVRGVYNHGWLIGGGEAITGSVQAELDAMLEIAPSAPSNSGTSSSSTSSTATAPATP